MAIRKIKAALLAVVAMGAVTGTAASAATVLSSGAYAAGARIAVGSAAAADVRVGAASGSGTGAYDQRTAIAAGTQNLTLVDTFTTDLVQSLSVGTGLAEAAATGRAATGSLTATRAGAAFDLTGLGAVDLFGIAVDAIGSTATVGIGDGGALVAGGNATIAGLRFTGLAGSALTFDAGLLAADRANTTLLSLAGLTVKLNEQIETADGAGGLSRQTNALRLSFNDFALDPLGATRITGDVVLGHAQAAISGYLPGAVPEPASWAMMIVGFGAVGTALRRQRPARAIA